MQRTVGSPQAEGSTLVEVPARSVGIVPAREKNHICVCEVGQVGQGTHVDADGVELDGPDTAARAVETGAEARRALVPRRAASIAVQSSAFRYAQQDAYSFSHASQLLAMCLAACTVDDGIVQAVTLFGPATWRLIWVYAPRFCCS